MTKLSRFESAQKAERNYWEKYWKNNRDGEARSAEYWQYYINLLRAHASPKPQHKILDIGCGPRGLICYLREGLRYGLDPLMDFYLSNFDMPKEVEWISGSGENIPAEDGFFDIVITTNAIDHTQNPRRFMSEICRVLKEDGFLFLTVNAYSGRVRLVKALLERIAQVEAAHPHFFTFAGLRQLVEESGFRVLGAFKGLGGLGVATETESTAKTSDTIIMRTKRRFHTAMEIRREEGFKSLVATSLCFAVLSVCRARERTRDSIVIAVKQPS